MCVMLCLGWIWIPTPSIPLECQKVHNHNEEAPTLSLSLYHFINLSLQNQLRDWGGGNERVDEAASIPFVTLETFQFLVFKSLIFKIPQVTVHYVQ